MPEAQAKPAAPAAKPTPPPVAATAQKPADAATAKEKTKVETVKMNDGRLVEFPGKRRLMQEAFVAADGTVSVRLDWRNGETRTFKPKREMYGQFCGHGAKQKLGDEAAGIEDIEDAVEVVDELIARLDTGQWDSKREGGGAGASILLRAIVAVTNKPIEAIRGFLKDLSNKEKDALAASPEFAPKVKELREAKAANAKPVDITAAMAKLKAM